MNLISIKYWLKVAQKAVCSMVVFALIFTQLLSASVLAAVIQPADPPNDPKIVYDLIAVVVDIEIDKNSTSYQGLRNKYPSELEDFTAQVNGSNITMSGLTLSERIMRYAEDLRASNNLTDVKILFYDKEKDSVQDLALALENLYINGESTHNNRLVGTVFVGDIPMPVVNKNGNRFMSLFPYTDFEDKTYIYDSGTKSFELNADNIFPKPEIWHGIINAPVEELAEYFDKNHLYYTGVPEFAEFGKRLFFADFVNEEEALNDEIYKKYMDYIEAAEDLTYMRYNKFWASELTDEVVADLTINEENEDGVAFGEALEDMDLTDTVPDIYSKNIIDQFYLSYYQVFGKYISKINDFVDGTGRYALGDADSVPVLLTIKDEYNKYYLRAVNDAIERNVNEMVEKMEEKLPLLTKTRLSGGFEGGADFGVAVSGSLAPANLPLGWKMEDIYFRYHYYNEQVDTLYINGIAADDLENAKQCSVFLGSTREDLDGDYSILTSAVRTNNVMTSVSTPTAGVNTRLLAPEEAFALTGGAMSNGAVIETGEYGMPAFSMNDLFGDGSNYMSPLQEALAEGDVITKVNGELIDAYNSFDLAIKNSYEWVKGMMDLSNSDAYADGEKTEILESIPYEVAIAPNDTFINADAEQAGGIIEIEFYRGGQKYIEDFSFSVHKDGYATRGEPEGNPELVVIMSPSYSGDFDSQSDFNSSGAWSDGTIFSLYNTDKRGFDKEGYDSSAGCNANSADENGGRCFPFLATIPVLDPAGSVNVRTAEDSAHPYLFQIPEGTSYEDIDEVIYDQCYFGMPSLESLDDDSNPYPFPLDPSEKNIMDYSVNQDFYGSLLDKIGEYVDSDDGNDPDSSPGSSSVWHNLSNLTAGDLVLNNYLLSDKVTLKHFSDRYGLFDGIDNDGDGVRDYYWEDTDNDGVYDTKVYDAEEADTIYGISPANLGEIARKMLSHDTTYYLPSALSPFSNDIVLNISVSKEKDISSMILHNEPTNFTITEQLKSMAAMDLPIDNPRYVAFQSEPVPLPEYPGVNETPHYFPGATEKVYYPNLFDYSNFAELEVALDQLAWDIAMIPGSYKLDTGLGYTDCRIPVDNYTICKDLHDHILETYLSPVVGFSGDMDSPNDFEIEEASVKKVYDALAWQHFNIDQKHEYVLEKYLNDGENSFVGDATLFPAPAGYTLGYGYEAAYLVLDGESNYFDMSFNKDIPEEDDENFDPLALIETEEEGGIGGIGGGGGGQEEGGEEGDKDDFEFVWLDQFLKETVDFITGFGSEPEFKDCCGFSQEQSDERAAEEAGAEEAGVDTATYQSSLLSDLPLDKLGVIADKETVYAGGNEILTVEVSGYDVASKLVGPLSDNPLISLKILQNDDNPLMEFVSYNEKALVNGKTEFELRTTGEIGNIVIYAESSSGVMSDSVPVKVTSRRVDFSSFTYFEPDVDALNEFLEEIGALEDDEEEDDAGYDEIFGDLGAESEESGPWEDRTLDFILENIEDIENLAGDEDDEGDEGDEPGVEESEAGEVVEEVVEGAVEGALGTDVEEDLEDILSDIAIEEEVDEEMVEEISDVGEVAEEEKDIIILESELVEVETEDDVVDDAVDEEVEAEGVEGWKEYYLNNDYYNKFIDNDAEVNRSRMVAELFSDSMIAFIPDDENPFVNAVGDEESQYLVESNDEMVADGESLMMVTVAIFNEEGILETDSRKQVRFSIVDSDVTDIIIFENGNIAESENGTASVYLRAGTTSGAFKIQAEVLDENGSWDSRYPLQDKQLYLVAGEVASVLVETNSCPAGPDECILIANNQFKSKLKVSLQDKFGNPANNSFAQISLFVDDKAYFDESADTNSQILGTQLGTVGGEAFVDIYAKDESGSVDVIAILMDYKLEEEFIEFGNDFLEIDFSQYVGSSRRFEILDNVSLNISPDKTSIGADGDSVMKIQTELFYGGQVVTNYSGPVSFTILNDNLGHFVFAPPQKMVEGVLHSNNVKFQSSTVSGDVEILVEIPGAVSDTVGFKTLPGVPDLLELSSSSDYIYSDGIEDVILEARLLDEYGNLVNTNDGTGVLVNFSTTEATDSFVDFPNGPNALSLDGIASLRVTGGDISGKANIIAVAEGVENPATISLKVTKHISAEMANDFLPRALYVSLLGGVFGNFEDEKNLSEILLYSKKTESGEAGYSQIQAVSSITAVSEDKKRLVGVDAYGKIDLMADSVTTSVVAATDSFPYQKIIFSDGVDDLELATVFMIPDPNSSLILLDEEEELADIEETGIYVKNVSMTDPEIEFEERDDGVYIVKSGETKAKIDNFGRIFINDDLYELELVDSEGNLAFAIRDRIERLAIISFKQNFAQDVKFVAYGESFSSFPGVYFKSNTSSNRYGVAESFSRASTNEPMGLYLLDLENEIDAGQAPYFPDSFGIGFDGDNKYMLFFAAGNSLGQSHIPYGSEVGIIYGDPNIRLEVEGIVGMVSQLSGYTKTIEKSIYTSDEDITELLSFDYNGDGLDDILLVYENGRIRLLEHEISNRHFRDRGYILNAYGGAVSAVGLDINNDGYDDLVLGTKESCAEGEEHVSVYMNTNGHFERDTLDLAISGVIVDMKTDDMNSDGCADLIASDSAGNIRVFYNQNDGESCTGLESNYGYSRNFGYELDSNENLKDNLFIYYPGVGAPTGEYITFILESDTPPATEEEGAAFASDVADLYDSILGNDAIASVDIPPLSYPAEFDFIHIADDSNFGPASLKQSIDVNGETITSGDKINYVITLENSGGTSVSDLMISDFTPVTATLQLDSLECLDSGCSDDLQWEETDMTLRSHVIKNISVPAGGKRTIKYSLTLNATPDINFDVGDFDNQHYSDILVKPSYNPEGGLSYLYSGASLTSNGYNDFDLIYEPTQGADLSDDLPIDLDALSGMSTETPSDPENISAEDAKKLSKIPIEIKLQMNSLAYPQDSNYSGCADSWDALSSSGGSAGGLLSSQSAHEAVANSVQNIVKTLRCSSGCLPIPYNYAFFAPDDATPGIPIFSAGHSWPGGIGMFIPSSVTSTFRLYLSPTLTLGLGVAVCSGPSTGHVSPCFAFSIPLTQALGVCDKIAGPVNNAIATASSSTVSPDIGMATVVSDGKGGADTSTTSGNFAYSDKKSPVSAAGAVNIKIPGFPSVITNWIDKQSSEIYNKLLDFPTFYFIYPDFKTLLPDSATFQANFSEIKNHYDFLRVINSIPLIQVESKEVLIRIPALSKDELVKWKRQADAWLKYEESEIERFLNYYKCDAEKDETRKTLCDKFVVNTKKLTQSVRDLMGKIDKIANLPRDVLNWKTLESKYATQIICWLDAIMEFTGGYVRKQSKIVKSWIKAAEDAVRTFQSWKAVLNLAADYQKSCDQCKNDRFSKLNILMKLFAAIPDLPVIPLPKWPDIVVDFSQLKTGVKVVWPDLKFKAESVRLPDLPYFTFPTDFPPDLLLELPSFDIPDWLSDFPDFIVPNIPDLPTLQIPKLPDLPRPPKIPKLPKPVVKLATSLKVIFKILCLLKKGLIPIPEAKLATEIETLTQASLKAALPIIGKLGIQTPPIKYDFVEQIRITAKLDIGLELSTIYLIVKAGAELMNEGVKNMIGRINDFLKLNLQKPINDAVKALENAAKEGVKEAVESAKDETEETVEEISFDTFDSEIFNELSGQFEEMDTILNDYISAMEIEDLPDTYYLTATSEYLDPSDPMMNRSLAEIELDIQNQDLPDTPEIQRLTALRDAFIDYTKNLNSTNDSLMNTIEDYDEFTRVLVENDNDFGRELAALTVPADFADGSEPEIKEAVFDLFDGDLFDGEWIAADVDPVEAVSDMLDGDEAFAIPAGFYVAVGNQGQNESVLSYISELTQTVHTIFSDVDADGDHDIIFSMGGDVYFKENYSSATPLSSYSGKGDVILSATDASVSDFVHEGGASVQGVTSPYENNNKVDVSWTAFDGAASYEVLIKRSLLHSDEDAIYTYTVDVPYISLEIENGNYYVVVYAINADGERSLASTSEIVAPQMCADKDAPFPAVTQTEYDLSIFKELKIDASGSFDTSGEVTEYYLEGDAGIMWSDLNSAIDGDGDGVLWNDRNNPVFRIGPFDEKEDVGILTFILNVVDQSGHASNQELSVNVFVPEISLDNTVSRTYEAVGQVIPEIDALPFSILRSRYIYRSIDDELYIFPRVDKVETSSADADGKYFTDGSGSYLVTDFNLEDMILVEDSDGVIVAEIHPETGNVGELLPGYSAVVNVAIPPLSPTSIDILDENGDVMASIYLISDPNQDVEMHEDIFFDSENYEEFDGVNVSDVDPGDEFEFFVFPASDPNYPGGAALIHSGEEKQILLVDSAGNILILDERVTIRLKDNDHTMDPLVIEVLFEGRVVAEIYISMLIEDTTIVGPNDVPFATPRAPSASVFYGVGADSRLIPEFDPEELVKRSEFVKVLLDMLCIIPRPSAYESYEGTEGESGGGFYDLVWNAEQLPDYYEYIKEADLLGLVYGYTGETDPVTGLHPFKANATITRAETANIILEALEFKGVLNLDELTIGEPWYEPIITAAQDMTPYINEGFNLKNNFIITSDEALEPNKEMTHEDLVIMVERVLELYACYEIDEDLDGMSDFCELKYGIDDPYADVDNDGLKNTNECYYKTDPTNPDTDGGGMYDGSEFDFGTDPLNPYDDPDDSDNDGCSDLSEIIIYKTDPFDPDTDDDGINDCSEEGEYSEAEPGIYIVPANCNSCPCVSTLLHKADLIPGDIIFTVISTYEEDYIFSKSNEVTIQ